MVSNRVTGMRYRDEVLTYLLLLGAPVDRGRSGGYRLPSQALGDTSGQTHTDITGLAPWSIDCRTGVTFDLSTAMNEAAADAAAGGTEWFVSIQNRKAHGVEESYAILPLHLMARLMMGEVPSAPALDPEPLPGSTDTSPGAGES